MFKIHRLVTLALAVSIVLAVTSAPAGAYVRSCGWSAGYSVAANGMTSCPFARSVAAAFSSGRSNPYVYSPVTGHSYQMYCSRASYRTVRCRGGNNAYVRLRR